MNQRMKELIKKAMEPSGLEGIGGSYYELNAEILIKLVVQECIAVAQNNNHNSGDEWDRAASAIEEEIKELFEIKN